MNKLTGIIISLMLLFTACNDKKSAEKSGIDENERLTGIFSILDGRWEGTFYIYADTSDRLEYPAMPKEISEKYFHSLPLKLVDSVSTIHIYHSENSFRQSGEIIDKYFDKKGRLRTVKSKAENYVENGKLKCLVRKPDEEVRHNGELIDKNTFLWYRKINNPVKAEFFRETVDSLHYKIIGWGYYGNDDTNLSPRNWFYADYIKTGE
ncbi:MAG: hypothetical protein Kow0098_22430 [Ignavibacteriaceae bacterium]